MCDLRIVAPGENSCLWKCPREDILRPEDIAVEVMGFLPGAFSIAMESMDEDDAKKLVFNSETLTRSQRKETMCTYSTVASDPGSLSGSGVNPSLPDMFL